MSLRSPGGILLLSSYELGHAPHALAQLAGFLEAADFAPRVIDLSVERLAAADVTRADLVVFSTPMHTALRLALPVLDQVLSISPAARIAFVGHYAYLHRDLLTKRGVDWVLAGELETELTLAIEEMERGQRREVSLVSLGRQRSMPAPSRRQLDLSRYARFIDASGDSHIAGYTETTRGCLERCRHCPVPAVYNGRFVAIDQALVLGDIELQLEKGAKHVTFGDPDFLNGPTHARRICTELHRRWPEVTFDFTAQVANLLEHATLTAELAELGCAFVVTAVESLSDEVLHNLGKRHRADDVHRLLDLADSIGLALRPTLVPFTPWTALDDIAALTTWIAERRLERHVAPVQLSVRLLVPPGSLVLESHPEAFGPFDEARLGHGWTSPDPRVDELAGELARITSEHADAGLDDLDSHRVVRDIVERFCELPASSRDETHRPSIPRVSEPWFC